MFAKTTILNPAQVKEAKYLLENETLKRIFSNLEDTYIKALIDSPVRDVEGRENLYKAVKVLGKVKQHLQSIVDDGKIKDKEIADLKKQ